MDSHKEKIPAFNQQVIDNDFEFLKDRLEIDLWDYMKDVHAKMNMEEMMTHHKILVARVTEYRKDVVRRKGLRWKKYRDWLAENVK